MKMQGRVVGIIRPLDKGYATELKANREIVAEFLKNVTGVAVPTAQGLTHYSRGRKWETLK